MTSGSDVAGGSRNGEVDQTLSCAVACTSINYFYLEMISIFNSNNNYNEFLLELQESNTGDTKDFKLNGKFLAFVLYPIFILPVLPIWC